MEIKMVEGCRCGTENTKKVITEMFEAACQFMGEKYRNHIINTIENDVEFYQCQEGEELADAFERLAGIKLSDEEKENINKTVPALTFSSNKTNGKEVIIYSIKEIRGNNYKATLAHEVFGHAVCRRINGTIAKKNGKKYKRDGICLIDLTIGDPNLAKYRNRGLNEGFMDWIATNIMRILDPTYKQIEPRLYQPLEEAATKIPQKVGKEKVFDCLIEGAPIENLAKDLGIIEEDFNTFLKILDIYLDMGIVMGKLNDIPAPNMESLLTKLGMLEENNHSQKVSETILPKPTSNNNANSLSGKTRDIEFEKLIFTTDNLQNRLINVMPPSRIHLAKKLCEENSSAVNAFISNYGSYSLSCGMTYEEYFDSFFKPNKTGKRNI